MMVADPLSCLQSYHMDESYLDENIQKCYVYHVEGMWPVDTVNSIEGNALRKTTIVDLTVGQHGDDSCPVFMNQMEYNDRPFQADDGRVLSRLSRLDGALQHVIPASLRQTILYQAHDPALVGHPGGRCTYDTVQPLFYWRHTANVVYYHAKCS